MSNVIRGTLTMLGVFSILAALLTINGLHYAGLL